MLCYLQFQIFFVDENRLICNSYQISFVFFYVRRCSTRKTHWSSLVAPYTWPFRFQSTRSCHCLVVSLFLANRHCVFRIAVCEKKTKQERWSLLTFPDGISTPLKASSATRGPCPRWSLIRGCRSNRAMEEHTSSEKWWSSMRRFLNDPRGISCRWLNSMGTSLGRRPALAGFVVDQAIVWADPHATRFVCLPWKAIHRRHQHPFKITELFWGKS